MKIAGLQKLTTSDFPGVVSAIVFTQGCNLKCPYCQNSGLIPIADGQMTEDEVLEFLEKRKKVLDGVVISGGEPLIQNDVKDFIIKVKNLGYMVKLDTNGTNPILLKALLDENLLDYVAMDIKNDFENYALTTGVQEINITNIKQSIELLKSSKVAFEFRTTIVKEFHNILNLQNIMNNFSEGTNYYLQNFEDSSNVINHNLHGFTHEELIEIQKALPNAKVRGIQI
jgi:pyruvate formate lyase activating enzyme